MVSLKESLGKISLLEVMRHEEDAIGKWADAYVKELEEHMNKMFETSNQRAAIVAAQQASFEFVLRFLRGQEDERKQT